MTQFIKNIFSSCLGTILAFFAGILLLVAIGSAIGSLSDTKKVENDSVLSIRIPEIMPERTNNTDFGIEQALQDENVWSIHELVYGIEQAASDNKIKAMVIEPGGGASPVMIDLIREAIQKFKKSDKPVYTYSEYYTQGTYYLASAADQIYLHPFGFIELKGFSITQPYLKEAMDNLGITWETYYAGDFKSASEPFRATEMSEENRLQLKELLQEIHTEFVDTIASCRNISQAEVNRIIKGYESRSASDALSFGLADKIAYESDMISELRSDLDLAEDKKLDILEFTDYRSKIKRKTKYREKDRIAVVYAEGEIRNGQEGETSVITPNTYIPILREIREDDNVKAVVLRVNSGGGDMFVSDNILREIELIQEAGKPVIASMGDFAASGGYYIAMSADTILASSKTITGSIGVFAMFPNISGTLEDKMNIYMDSVSTAPYATMGSIVFERSENERQIFQDFIDSAYVSFIDRVANARNMTRDQVHEVAQGRVWMGKKAKELGLVDAIGGLDEALSMAQSMASLEEFRTVEYPKMKNPIQQLTEQLEGKDDAGRKIIVEKAEQILPGVGVLDRLLRAEHPRIFVEYSLPYRINWE